MLLNISFMATKNNVTLLTDPCGSPLSNVVWSVRKLCKNFNMFPSMDQLNRMLITLFSRLYRTLFPSQGRRGWCVDFF